MLNEPSNNQIFQLGSSSVDAITFDWSEVTDVEGDSVYYYFTSEVLKMVMQRPLVITETANKFNLFVRVRGGGFTGQAGAIRHGIARALLMYNPELRPTLKAAGLLTRDPRKVERKKYGQPGARKRFQFSKR
jgi:small subunit ribosomal protein S9